MIFAPHSWIIWKLFIYFEQISFLTFLFYFEHFFSLHYYGWTCEKVAQIHANSTLVHCCWDFLTHTCLSSNSCTMEPKSFQNRIWILKLYTVITHGLYIFYPIFHCGLYCRAVSITDNFSIFWPQIRGLHSRAGYMACVR